MEEEGWNEDVAWGEQGVFQGLVNAPSEILLKDLEAATNERLPGLGLAPIESIKKNKPVNVVGLRNAMVDVLTSPFPGLFGRYYVKPNPSGEFSWLNESEIVPWSLAEMEAELEKPEPEYYETGSSLSAEWVKWWYDALNLVTHGYYGEGPLSGSKRDVFGSTFSEAVDNFNSSTSWDTSNTNFNSHSVRTTSSGGAFIDRFYTQQLVLLYPGRDPSSPGGGYQGDYTVSVWAKFTKLREDHKYDNADFPCTVDTFNQVFGDSTVQNGEYDRNIIWGNIETSSVSDPGLNETGGWFAVEVSPILKFDIEGGFKYIAPEE